MCLNLSGFQGVYVCALNKAGVLWIESWILFTEAPSSHGPLKTAVRGFRRDPQVLAGCFSQQLTAVPQSRALQELPWHASLPHIPCYTTKNIKRKEIWIWWKVSLLRTDSRGALWAGVSSASQQNHGPDSFCFLEEESCPFRKQQSHISLICRWVSGGTPAPGASPAGACWDPLTGTRHWSPHSHHCKNSQRSPPATKLHQPQCWKCDALGGGNAL